MFFQAVLLRKKLSRGDKTRWQVVSKVEPNPIKTTITWVGHATVLVQVGGKNILTDPIFGAPSFLFPRISPPGISFENLPKIDFVLISHNHRDHTDKKSILDLQKRDAPKFLVPEGDKAWFNKLGIDSVEEFIWWESSIHKVLQESLKFTFLPAKHWSQRALFKRNMSLWGSWMISLKDQNIYFGGDSAYDQYFLQIAKEFPKIDVAMLSIAPCEPSKWMKDSHMDPEDAIKAFGELNAKHLIPIHWGTFCFGTDCFDYPVLTLDKERESIESGADKQLNILRVGESLILK
jgi:N-acyl-phosphatidylethanolamine-hydrolysing phospholipase D